ncbi:sensor histidine kinase [uncultured Clostridium sp.]|jgi:two-component system sensor histidine kinase YesM|uniref:sensor histidine kinase n=1 Tax=uncultured Clostridium sp. TaxID=59620 RepID=UPI00261B4062|nr:sensor histidine kinase [uncultured Clostridium sp.]
MDKKGRIIYKKLFVVYTAVIILLIALLDLYFLNYSMDLTKENKMYVNQQLVNAVSSNIDNQFVATGMITDGIYTYRENILDLLKFLELDFNEYKKQKLDAIVESPGAFYNGTETLVKRSFETYPTLSNITTISKVKKEARIFNRNTQIDFRAVDDYDKIKEENVISGNNSITHVIKINDTTNLEEKGLMLVTYKLSDFREIIKKHEMYNDVFIIDKMNNLIYDSGGIYDETWFENFSEDLDNKSVFIKKAGDYHNLSYINNEIIVVGKVSKMSLTMLPIDFCIALALIDMLVFAIAEGIIYLKIKKLNSRLENTVDAMGKVQSGDLTVRIKTNNENDELSYIGDSFNEMCEELDRYIKRSYLAEINQKNAEMKHLQSQINPHFLYNTLEVIRMKAICNGDKEVGKMLYNLAVLFRSQLKEKDIITIKTELDYCKKYLELFKFRYQEKFNYEINCDQELLENNIIKFVLQPIIENYVVHGVRLADSDNKLDIRIESQGNDINIYIIDNGIGISTEKLEQIKTKLSDKNLQSDSIGIVNVNQRIKNIYGDKYGVTYIEGVEVGTTVLIKIPINKGEGLC